MDYFRILNLNREPFSNSPEPEFFFPSVEHVGCLQKLELAVRLRRGLNVVIGDVGTGKTTLCRQLTLKFAASEEGRRQIETHLLMDPAFTNPREFLSIVAMTLGISEANNQDSEWQLKESIKGYLFKKGIDDDKIVVFLIDEGQKLPDFCLELLREFLNYETNEYKLLQIIVFAQREFEQTLKRLKNIADRVNLYYLLHPLNFQETRGMVRSRIAKASNADKTPSLFTSPGLWALYTATKGYPRKIVTLGHQIILTLIIQNRLKAGWFLVRSCARRGSIERRRKVRWAVATTLAALSIVIIIAGLYPGKMLNIKHKNEPSNVATAVHSVSDELPMPPGKMPDLLGKVTLKSGRTVWRLLFDFYGNFDNRQFQAVALANQHINNLNRVNAGEMIKLPALPAKSNPLLPGKYWVQVVRGKNVEEIYELYKSYEHALPSLRFLPYWNGREGLVFAIFLQGSYINMESALGMSGQLPYPLASLAKVISKLDDDTVFFTNRRER